MNHWRIPKIISYYPEDNVNKPLDMDITKNIYSKPIQGRDLRVIAELLKLHNQKQFENNNIPMLAGKPARFLEIERANSYIWGIMRNWADKGYPITIKEED